jgi:lipoic acid synthetase
MNLPYWFRQKFPDTKNIKKILGLFSTLNLNTVCEEAHCPNIDTCFKNKSVSFMILGDRCSRGCRFCAVKKAYDKNLSVDYLEPHNIAQLVITLGLNYVVITSVTRDDLVDGGAGQFVRTTEEIRKISASVMIELLIPDFEGKISSLEAVCKAKPDVIGHNLETVPRIYKDIKPLANYSRSLELLRHVKEIDRSIYTKSSLLLGLGESLDEVEEVIYDLRSVGCDILTLGQYLAPSQDHFPVKEYLNLERFEDYRRIGLTLGFKAVSSGPLIRSSSRAEELFRRAKGVAERCMS